MKQIIVMAKVTRQPNWLEDWWANWGSLVVNLGRCFIKGICKWVGALTGEDLSCLQVGAIQQAGDCTEQQKQQQNDNFFFFGTKCLSPPSLGNWKSRIFSLHIFFRLKLIATPLASQLLRTSKLVWALLPTTLVFQFTDDLWWDFSVSLIMWANSSRRCLYLSVSLPIFPTGFISSNHPE